MTVDNLLEKRAQEAAELLNGNVTVEPDLYKVLVGGKVKAVVCAVPEIPLSKRGQKKLEAILKDQEGKAE